jgi:hypothetical protein
MSDGLEAELVTLYKRYELPDRPATDRWWDDAFAGLDSSSGFDTHKDLFRDWILRPVGFMRGRNGLLVWLGAEPRPGAPEPGGDAYNGPPVAHIWRGPTASDGMSLHWEVDDALEELGREPEAERAEELALARDRGRGRRTTPSPRIRRVGARVSLEPFGELAAALGSAGGPEVAAAVEDGAWLRVVTFVELEDGRRVTDEAQVNRGFAFGPRLWGVVIGEGDPIPDPADVRPSQVQRTLREVADGAKANVERDWFPLRVTLAEQGIDVEDAELARLPIDVEFDEQLRISLPP